MAIKDERHTASATLLNGTATAVPGQVVLPDMQEQMGYESAELEPWQEKFCWEYVENGGVGYKAYLAARPKVKETTARVEASKLLNPLTNPNIDARISAIRKELRARYAVTAEDLIGHHEKVFRIDRRRFFDESGKRIPIHKLDHELASIVDLDTAYSKDAGIMLLPAVANREKSKDALARIMGLDKSSTTIKHQFEEMSDDELKKYAEEMAREVLGKS